MGRRRKIKSGHPRALNIDSRPIGVYVHIPFCRRKCDYCDFYSISDTGGKLRKRYTGAVIRHIADSSGRIGSGVDTVYFGGGTPLVLGVKNIIAILKELKKRFNLKACDEITIELNPESTGLKELKKLKRAGFNRVSIGIQSGNDDELKALGRIHDTNQAGEAFYDARQAGFKNISVDVMFGLEGQTMRSLDSTLDFVTGLEPEHISCYALKIEEGTPLSMRELSALPDDDGQADMYLRICEALRDKGYEHYEISNWAKPEYESKHNSRYWRLKPYIGFGPAAHSDCLGARYSCVRDIEKYIHGIENHEQVVDDFEQIREHDRLSEYIMLGLRTSEGIQPEVIKRTYGGDISRTEGLVKRYEKAGYMTTTDGWSLTDSGFLLSNTIILELLESVETPELKYADRIN